MPRAWARCSAARRRPRERAGRVAEGRWVRALRARCVDALGAHKRFGIAIWQGERSERAGLKSVSTDWLSLGVARRDKRLLGNRARTAWRARTHSRCWRGPGCGARSATRPHARMPGPAGAAGAFRGCARGLLVALPRTRGPGAAPAACRHRDRRRPRARGTAARHGSSRARLVEHQLPPDQLGVVCEVLACAIEAEEPVLVRELRARYLLPWCEPSQRDSRAAASSRNSSRSSVPTSHGSTAVAIRAGFHDAGFSARGPAPVTAEPAISNASGPTSRRWRPSCRAGSAAR